MKSLIKIQVFFITVYSICCLNESVLTIKENDSSLTTVSNATALNSLLSNSLNSSISTIGNSSSLSSSSSAIPLNETSDRHLSDPSSEQLVNLNKSLENNSQEKFSSKNCFETVCTENTENAPKVLVTQKSRTFIAIAFDDFKLPNYESGYVVQYRQLNLNNLTTDWTQIQANNTPFVTIRELRPHTTYQIQVLVWEDIDSKKLGLGSEIISVTTEDGCFVKNITYAVGQQFFEGCDRRCICRPNAKEECFPRF